ncbi:MAG TPA: hypothetical protein VF281_00870 [Candidatus Saccharimonadales bacterium]
MIIPTIIGLTLVSLVATYLTNPFSRFSVIRMPYKAKLQAKVLEAVDNNKKIVMRQNIFWRMFAYFQCGIYILTTRYIHSPGSDGKNVDEIISDIHQLRYDPNRLLLISGDHFNGLFVRNLGVFYYPMLDRSIPGTKEDWHNREIVYLQTVAYALGVFQKHPKLTTTIVSMGPYSATCINFYAYPSDSLFGMMYALAALRGIESAAPHDYGDKHHKLDTQKAAKTLVSTYDATLRELYESYKSHVFDDEALLIKRDVHLSGAKDITRRYSAFYDNVVFWKTTQLAMKLGVISEDKAFLNQLKETILKTFWLEDKGYFLEDLSTEGLANHYYSSDWLIVLSTGFLDITDTTERVYYERSIEHIQTNKIDQPFALRYQSDTRAHRQFFVVRMAVASYGGDAIWSFWGMEYIKALTLLGHYTGNNQYFVDAKYHLDAYESNMLRDRGFSETYDSKGNLLKTPMYQSIRQTGWVIGFEQARVMYQALNK